MLLRPDPADRILEGVAMLRTTVVGGWLTEERHRAALALYLRGHRDERESESLLKEVAAAAIAQQQACGLNEYTGGETSADSFILHFPRFLTGIDRSARCLGRPRVLCRDRVSRRHHWTRHCGCFPPRARH